MSATAFAHQVQFTVCTCGECGVQIAMPERYYDARFADHKTFYCLNGHPRAFQGPSEADKLRTQLQASRDNADWWKAKAAQREKTAAAYKGQVTRIKNRVKNGVCPCCNRTFQNLMRHMATKHPEYANTPPAEGDG